MWPRTAYNIKDEAAPMLNVVEHLDVEHQLQPLEPEKESTP